MRINAETTKEQIIAPVIAARNAMVQEATKAADDSNERPTDFYLQGENLLGLAQAVRNAEELMRVQLQYLAVCKNDPEERIFFLMDLLTSGNNDTWSGRGNDSIRASHDVIVSWVRKQVDTVRYGN